MSSSEARHAERLLDLRQHFDRSFAEAPKTDVTTYDDFLAIRVGGDPHAVRLGEIAGLYVDKPITRLPGPVSELVGLTGLRGVILPVWDLSALLGYPTSTEPRWLLVAAAVPVALAFDRFDGHLRVPRSPVAAQPADERAPGLREVVHAEELTRPVIRLASVLAQIATLVQQGAPQKE